MVNGGRVGACVDGPGDGGRVGSFMNLSVAHVEGPDKHVIESRLLMQLPEVNDCIVLVPLQSGDWYMFIMATELFALQVYL
jgi:hypothetical protein